MALEYRIDKSNKLSLDNWITRLSMQCSQGTDLGILGSVFFLGNAISSLFVPRMADIYGRKWVLAANQSVQFIAMVFLVNTSSYKIASFLMFVLGLCATGRWAIGYVYFSELLT